MSVLQKCLKVYFLPPSLMVFLSAQTRLQCSFFAGFSWALLLSKFRTLSDPVKIPSVINCEMFPFYSRPGKQISSDRSV